MPLVLFRGHQVLCFVHLSGLSCIGVSAAEAGTALQRQVDDKEMKVDEGFTGSVVDLHLYVACEVRLGSDFVFGIFGTWNYQQLAELFFKLF